MQNYNYAIAFVPYWFRFLQCLNKYYYTRVKPHLFNAGKYFFSMMMQLVNIPFIKSSGNPGYGIFIGVSIFSSLYSYTWDIYMDWGLLRSNEVGKKYLRHKILYH
jgi:hypothetical protein